MENVRTSLNGYRLDAELKNVPVSFVNALRRILLADPINSERLYAAIKGHGGTVRFVYLPYEAHGYRGKENVLHLLYEQGRWLDKYLKGK